MIYNLLQRMACPFAGGSSIKIVDPNNEEEAAQAGINKVELGQGVTYSQYLQVSTPVFCEKTLLARQITGLPVATVR